MRETRDVTRDGLPNDPSHRDEEENDITQPIRIISSQKGAPGNRRVDWLNKEDESARDRAPDRTLDWTEIGDPAA